MPQSTSPRAPLRQQLRSQRNALSPQQQHIASHALRRIFLHNNLLSGVQSIAFYCASDGEIDPQWLMRDAMTRKIACYLPVLAPAKHLWFVRYRRSDRLYKNRFNIDEPAVSQPRRKSWSLDLVLMPLVGFDRRGARLGMGGGFYDRSFNWLKHSPLMRRPKLVGLAHHCQEVDSLASESWDIPMDYIATDKELIKATSGSF